jgi:hypothetical protein
MRRDDIGGDLASASAARLLRCRGLGGLDGSSRRKLIERMSFLKLWSGTPAALATRGPIGIVSRGGSPRSTRRRARFSCRFDSWYCARFIARRERSRSRCRRRSRRDRLRSRCFCVASRSIRVTRIAVPVSCEAIAMLETLTSIPATRSAAPSATFARRFAADGDTYGWASTIRCAS